MPAAADPGALTWLMLVYRLPAKPAALEGMIRDRLTAAGAVYLSPEVAALPSSSAAERVLRRVQYVITDAGGSAILLYGEAIVGEAEMTAALNGVATASTRTQRRTGSPSNAELPPTVPARSYGGG